MGAGDGGHTLTISNDGNRTDGTSGVRSRGHGLANMAQRIEALGGAVQTDARDSGFVVTAVVPQDRLALVGDVA